MIEPSPIGVNNTLTLKSKKIIISRKNELCRGKWNTSNYYPPREAARCVHVLPPVQTARLSDMVLYNISVTTVRYGTLLYSAVKNYNTYGTQ